MKKEYILLLAMIIGLSAYLFLHKTDKVAYELPQLPDIDQKAITRISIQKQGETIELTRAGSTWEVGDHKYIADKAKIDRMLNAVSSLEVTVMVSESKNYDRFDLSDDRKINVQVSGDKDLSLNFDVGKTAGTRRHTFVKIKGDDRVYQARGNFRTNFDVTAEVMRDKQVLAVDKNSIQKIQFTKKDQTLVLSRRIIPTEVAPDASEAGENASEAVAPEETVQWETRDGNVADEGALDTFFDQLTDLRCNRFLYDQTLQDVGPPIYTVILTSMDPENQTYTLSVYDKGAEEKNEYPASSSVVEEPFIIPKWLAEKIMVDFDTLVSSPETKEQ